MFECVQPRIQWRRERVPSGLIKVRIQAPTQKLEKGKMTDKKERDVILKRYVSGCEQILEKDFFDHSVEVVYDQVRDRTILAIRAYVLSDNFQTYERRYPRDWWEAFKERWFPKVLLKKWPVIYRNIEVSIDALYPEYKPVIPKEKYFFHLNEIIEDE